MKLALVFEIRQGNLIKQRLKGSRDNLSIDCFQNIQEFINTSISMHTIYDRIVTISTVCNSPAVMSDLHQYWSKTSKDTDIVLICNSGQDEVAKTFMMQFKNPKAVALLLNSTTVKEMQEAVFVPTTELNQLYGIKDFFKAEFADDSVAVNEPSQPEQQQNQQLGGNDPQAMLMEAQQMLDQGNQMIAQGNATQNYQLCQQGMQICNNAQNLYNQAQMLMQSQSQQIPQQTPQQQPQQKQKKGLFGFGKKKNENDNQQQPNMQMQSQPNQGMMQQFPNQGMMQQYPNQGMMQQPNMQAQNMQMQPQPNMYAQNMQMQQPNMQMQSQPNMQAQNIQMQPQPNQGMMQQPNMQVQNMQMQTQPNQDMVQQPYQDISSQDMQMQQPNQDTAQQFGVDSFEAEMQESQDEQPSFKADLSKSDISEQESDDFSEFDNDNFDENLVDNSQNNVDNFIPENPVENNTQNNDANGLSFLDDNTFSSMPDMQSNQTDMSSNESGFVDNSSQMQNNFNVNSQTQSPHESNSFGTGNYQDMNNITNDFTSDKFEADAIFNDMRNNYHNMSPTRTKNIIQQDVDGIDFSDIDVVGDDEAYRRTTESKSGVRVVTKEVIRNIGNVSGSVGTISNIYAGRSHKIVVVTGDRGTGITSTALSIAQYMSKKVPILYFDLDVDNHGLLSYINYDTFRSYETTHMAGIKHCRNSNAFYNCVVSYDNNFDILTTDYSYEVSDEEISSAQGVVAEHINEYGVIIVDCPVNKLHLISDLVFAGVSVICVDATKRGFMNMLCQFENSPLDVRYKRSIVSKGTMFLTKYNKGTDLKKLTNFVKNLYEPENVDWLSMPSSTFFGGLNDEFLNSVFEG